MDVEAVTDALTKFADTHEQVLAGFPQRETQLLELAAMTLVSIHYERAGYAVRPSNVDATGAFRMKRGTNGHPANFSWWTAERGEDCYEIHANLPVESNYADDEGIYVVDVSVIRGGSLKQLRRVDARRVVLPNELLITFAEVKKLVVYPMLLAQFVGIVHEILPRFLYGRRPRRFAACGHFDPALITIGYLHATSRKIVSAYAIRGFRVTVVPGCDRHLSKLVEAPAHKSPLAR